MYSYAIVIVTYNRLKMLKTCLEHAFGQTMKPCAVVVVDNCSTDGTSEYLDQLKRGKEYPSESMRFLLYHEKENNDQRNSKSILLPHIVILISIVNGSPVIHLLVVPDK